MLLRDAVDADLASIRDIYNHAVEHSTAIWNEVLVDVDNRRQWWNARVAKGYPVLVAIVAGKVAGYASYGDWRAFDGYRHTVEHSVYVDPEARGAGIGEQLMRALIERAAAGNVHVMIAGIEAENAASIRLHEKLGFRVVGTFSEVGIKFGRWLDLTCMELRILS
ncbi:GNAT family N-acetyltransferase [Rhizobium sp. VS19-DR104.2]|nr:GNAT family N-acetyltransferase [Rhizobium sp. VS19-DR96]MBZ5767820.1 GNAT family N-acetyltransferase [Rhizobium sp. VS19-DR129.2]MBZ5773654.1 GNAT family N-acetyltransferase [Rhizobium sp. VS19-DRK62.2]MBZ5786437.1 GNAT family N-acetyltransferase [Rhizobium sp. VS19-DR121]MBZ5802190.1 GNAT family N-acetyltransferase [Rhizobium sp. VS19-DR181]MBZ5819417.1 GNAT family N-acetyltransferase [Rhizobium sp. VS19-DR183]MBZ5830601.1 GNAT family N-acetyltransferase [Rhizobium sp. VS19-DR104.2]MBZ5